VRVLDCSCTTQQLVELLDAIIINDVIAVVCGWDYRVKNPTEFENNISENLVRSSRKTTDTNYFLGFADRCQKVSHGIFNARNAAIDKLDVPGDSDSHRSHVTTPSPGRSLSI